ncbi:hypothetical protein PSP6_80006 [Paraburkholderia tropica]|nr:hypothetical protein PSP6_80006 [Paraburkholderia tropica]
MFEYDTLHFKQESYQRQRGLTGLGQPRESLLSTSDILDAKPWHHAHVTKMHRQFL